MQPGMKRLNRDSIKDIQDYCIRILTAHKNYRELEDKARTIDTLYYRYQTQQDQDAGNEAVGINVDNVVIPIVINQVDSFVGYMSEVFLSGYPIFPVVSGPKAEDVQLADKMEAMIDTHATLGGYARQLLKFFHQGIRYNFSPLLTEWKEIDTYGLVTQALNTKSATKMEQAKKGYTCIKSLSVYNTIWDYRYHPAEVAERGDFTGYLDRISKYELKKLMNRLQIERTAYNMNIWNNLPTVSQSNVYWTNLPEVNKYIKRAGPDSQSQTYWSNWLGRGESGLKSKNGLNAHSYEIAYMYLRILPADANIDIENPSSPQIFKAYIINGQTLIGFERVVTPYGDMPIRIGTPLEDHFGLKASSIAENQVVYQAAATSLFKIRIEGARRAIMDRGIFDADLINPSDINSKNPAAKIPARLKGLQDRKLTDAYYPIPYDGRGADSAIQDMGSIFRFADMNSGLNSPQRGEFQKGNKSVEEWRDTMGNADNRLRLPALNCEFQILMPLKEDIKFNLFLNGEAGSYTSMKKGYNVDVKPEDFAAMQEKSLTFRVADGYTPKSKLASTDAISSFIQLIGQNQSLLMAFGPMLPQMVAHLAQLMGIRDLAQYAPDLQAIAKQTGQPVSQQLGIAPPAAPAGQQPVVA